MFLGSLSYVGYLGSFQAMCGLFVSSLLLQMLWFVVFWPGIWWCVTVLLCSFSSSFWYYSLRLLVLCFMCGLGFCFLRFLPTFHPKVLMRWLFSIPLSNGFSQKSICSNYFRVKKLYFIYSY